MIVIAPSIRNIRVVLTFCFRVKLGDNQLRIKKEDLANFTISPS